MTIHTEKICKMCTCEFTYYIKQRIPYVSATSPSTRSIRLIDPQDPHEIHVSNYFIISIFTVENVDLRRSKTRIRCVFALHNPCYIKEHTHMLSHRSLALSTIFEIRRNPSYRFNYVENVVENKYIYNPRTHQAHPYTTNHTFKNPAK